ncbi:MAG: DEAD/DEAH box helicase [Acidobacteria bacterium]|nr:DEAD/DEAH box helicase [Acidobacteriota bacterium]
MQKPSFEVRAGDLVRVRDYAWRVRHVQPFDDCTAIAVTGVEPANRDQRRTFLCPFDRPHRLTRTEAVRMVGRGRWARAFRALAVTSAPCDGLHVAAFARVTLVSYQLEPALALVGGLSSRVLLADEVGLGKTVQAALALAELWARGDMRRALILTPAGIRDQWREELLDRFGLEVSILDAAILRRESALLPSSINPWMVPRLAIASLDFIKQAHVLAAIRRVPWDLLVIDEAHGASIGTDRGAAARVIASNSRRVLLLTATPHAGDDAAFAWMCGIGRIGERARDPIAMFRRTRRDVGQLTTRVTKLLHVATTPDERCMHDELDRYIRLVVAETAGRETSQPIVAMCVLQKRALSSADSLARSVARRLQLVDDPGAAAEQGSLPFEDPRCLGETDEADEEPASVLASPGMIDRATERTCLTRVLEAARRAALHESKCRALQRVIRRTTDSVIVFTEYRDTLARLAEAVAPLGTVALLHGGLSRADRRESEKRFNTGSARVLLATDAAGEGLNLQARARWVVNYELPWNPMRLEQRVGRLDRIGQQRRVHATHLVARGTREESLLGRLATRVERVRRQIGDVADVLGRIPADSIPVAMLGGDSVFSDAINGLDSRSAHDAGARANSPGVAGTDFRHVDVSAAAEVELGRLQTVRRLLAPPDAPHSLSRADSATLVANLERRGPWVSTLRRSRVLNRQGLLAIFRLACLDGTGRPIHSDMIAMHLPARLPARFHAHVDARHKIEELLVKWRPILTDRAGVEARSKLAAVDRHLAGSAAQRDRDRVLFEHALRESRQLHQPGLFDPRAREEGPRQATEGELLIEELERRLAAAAGAARREREEMELVLVGVV